MSDGSPVNPNIFYWDYEQYSGTSYALKKMRPKVRAGLPETFAGVYNLKIREQSTEGSYAREKTWSVTLQTKCDYAENKSITAPTNVEFILGRTNVIDITQTNLGKCFYKVKLVVDDLLND